MAPLPGQRSALPPPPADPAGRVRWLSQRIDEVLSLSAASRGKIAIAVAEIESGRLLYARNDGLPLNPASNVKLVTTAAALSLLGPEFRFKTAVYAEGHGADRANLYLRGYGDPTLQVEDLWRIAGEVFARGVRRVTGDVIIDDSYFDEQRVGPGFEQKASDAAYRAPQGAVSLGYNAVGVVVMPGAGEGAAARVLIEPPSPYFEVKNEARTVARGRSTLTIETSEVNEPGKEHMVIHVRGAVRQSEGRHEVAKRVAHPDLFAGYTLRELLARRGVKVLGRITRGPVPTGAQVLSTVYSPNLGVIVRDINKRSNNFMAEQVLKSLGAEVFGRPGSWKKGIDAVGQYLTTLGVPVGRYQMQNGSGLYDANRFTAAQLVQILRTAYRDFRYAADFVGSLAVAGADGTIGHRMHSGLAERYVRAKTGTLQGVSCLSGYASGPAPGVGPSRGPLAFAVLMNDLPEDAGAPARVAQDQIAEALVQYLGGT